MLALVWPKSGRWMQLSQKRSDGHAITGCRGGDDDSLFRFVTLGRPRNELRTRGGRPYVRFLISVSGNPFPEIIFSRRLVEFRSGRSSLL
jgi:hypothetical protein